jgi:hypothetical protein
MSGPRLGRRNEAALFVAGLRYPLGQIMVIGFHLVLCCTIPRSEAELTSHLRVVLVCGRRFCEYIATSLF